MRKVAFVIPLLSSGGAERATAALASSIDRSRYEPLLILQSPGPRIYDPAPHVRVIEAGAANTQQALRPLTRILRAERPDLIYAILPHLSLLSAFAVQTMRVPRPKLVVSIHNNLGAELPQWSNGALLARLTPWVYRRADAITAVSTGAAEEAVRDFGAPPERVSMIPNPVDGDAIRAAAAERRPHRWLDAPEIRTVVAMGRLTAQKNVALLLDAFAQVAASDGAARLLILGDGELRAGLEAHAARLGIAEVVEFAGAQSSPHGYLVRADVFASSSDYEGFPLAHLEALALGVPVVATDCDYGPAEILGHGRLGVLTPTGSVAGFAAALGALLADPERRAALAADGPARVEAYRPERVVPQVEALFERLLT